MQRVCMQYFKFSINILKRSIPQILFLHDTSPQEMTALALSGI